MESGGPKFPPPPGSVSPYERVPTADLIKQALADVRTLVKEEVALAKTEATQSLKAGVGMAIGVAVAAVAAVLALCLLVTAAVLALALAVPAWLAAVIVAVVIAGAGGLTGMLMLKRRRDVHFDRTKSTLTRDVSFLKERLS